MVWVWLEWKSLSATLTKTESALHSSYSLTTIGKQAHTCSGLRFCLETFSFFLFPNLEKILFSITSQLNVTSKTTKYWAKDPAVQNLSKAVTSTICEVIPVDFPHFPAVKPLGFCSQSLLPWDSNKKVSALRGTRGWLGAQGRYSHTSPHPVFPCAFPNYILLRVCIYS